MIAFVDRVALQVEGADQPARAREGSGRERKGELNPKVQRSSSYSGRTAHDMCLKGGHGGHGSSRLGSSQTGRIGVWGGECQGSRHIVFPSSHDYALRSVVRNKCE